jgi:alkanesulfonate monooxygenase SsuD/methylene tetrahydromethanopterin reductase-like flavin-dependent oxidoreductase (luciferase family)
MPIAKVAFAQLDLASEGSAGSSPRSPGSARPLCLRPAAGGPTRGVCAAGTIEDIARAFGSPSPFMLLQTAFLRHRAGLPSRRARELRLPRAERGARLAEAVRAVRTLWSDDAASFDGRFYRFADVSIRPRPIQRPGPPIWMTLPATARRARPSVRRGADGQEMHVARDSRRAEETMRAPLGAMYASYARWGQPGERHDLDFDELEIERVLVGSPHEVAERVIEYRDEFDVPFMLFRLC